MGARTQAALQSEHWDYVVLQEYSNGPITHKASYMRNVAALCEQIRAAGATPVLYATWAYQRGGKQLASFGMDYDEMGRSGGIRAASFHFKIIQIVISRMADATPS